MLSLLLQLEEFTSKQVWRGTLGLRKEGGSWKTTWRSPNRMLWQTATTAMTWQSSSSCKGKSHGPRIRTTSSGAGCNKRHVHSEAALC